MAQWKLEVECGLNKDWQYFASDELLNEFCTTYNLDPEDAEELETDNTRLIFDNAGGTTLQLNSWAHSYNGQDSQIADDLIGWMADGNTDDWEGHEPEALDIDVDVPYGYRVVNVDHDNLRDLLADLIKESWCSDKLFEALAARL